MGGSVLNYLDRTALSVASKTIKDEFRLSASEYALIVNGFLLAYTISYVLGGLIVDRLGTRRSFVIAVCWWSAANMSHALACTLWHLVGCRFLLGLGEAMFYPTAMRAFSEWFAPRDRSKPVGLMLAAATIGGSLAAPVVSVSMLTPWLGWRGAFALSGALGFLLVPPWLKLAHPPRGDDVIAENLHENGSVTNTLLPLRRILSTRAMWILIIERALTDAVWTLLVFWLLLYFQEVRGVSVKTMIWLGMMPWIGADLGALFGGWLSSALIRRGTPVIRARQISMMGFALLLPCALLGYLMPAGATYVALALCCVATFAHMAWGTNSLTLHTDIFPKNCVATVMGISGAAGSIGGIVAGWRLGLLVDSTHSYLPVFVTVACLHPIAGLIVLWGLSGARTIQEDRAQATGPS